MESWINPADRVAEERLHSHGRYAHRDLLRLPGLSAALGIILLLGTLSSATAEVHRRDLRRGHGPLVDALGDTLPAGPHPERIVSLSPNLTEILYALGVAPARIVGVTRYCDFPPEAKARPVVGGIVDQRVKPVVNFPSVGHLVVIGIGVRGARAGAGLCSVRKAVVVGIGIIRIGPVDAHFVAVV